MIARLLYRLDALLRGIERFLVEDDPQLEAPPAEDSPGAAPIVHELPKATPVLTGMAPAWRGWWAATTLVSAALALWLFRSGGQELAHDSLNYYTLSLQIARGGVFAFDSEARTFGYPLLLALTGVLTLPSAPAVRIAIVVLQWVALILVSFAGAKLSLRLSGSPRLALTHYAVTACNPYLLIAATTVLTDSLAATLTYGALLAFLPPVAALHLSRRPRVWPIRWSELALPASRLASAAACVAGAAMLRPGALVIAVPLLAVAAARLMMGARPPLRGTLLALGVAAVIFAPQAAANHRFDRRISVLPRAPLYEQQQLWGLVYLKYATSMTPGRSPQIFYRNPFLPQTIRGRPPVVSPQFPAYLATLVSHMVGVLDQDLPFTYVNDAQPWYRWPSTLFSLTLAYCAAAGMWRVLREAVSRRVLDGMGLAVGASALAAAAHLALHAPAASETRFAVPLYLYAGLPIAIAIEGVPAMLRARGSAGAALTLGTWAGFMALGIWFSAWMQSLAAELRA